MDLGMCDHHCWFRALKSNELVKPWTELSKMGEGAVSKLTRIWEKFYR